MQHPVGSSYPPTVDKRGSWLPSGRLTIYINRCGGRKSVAEFRSRLHTRLGAHHMYIFDCTFGRWVHPCMSKMSKWEPTSLRCGGRIPHIPGRTWRWPHDLYHKRDIFVSSSTDHTGDQSVPEFYPEASENQSKTRLPTEKMPTDLFCTSCKGFKSRGTADAYIEIF